MTQQKSYLQWYLWEILMNSYFGNNGEEGLITELAERNYFLMPTIEKMLFPFYRIIHTTWYIN